MNIISLLFLTSLTHVGSSDNIWDNPTEALLSSSNPNVFDDSLVSSLTDTSDFLPDYFAEEIDFIETDASISNWNSLLANSPCQDSVKIKDHLAIFYPEVDPLIEPGDPFAQNFADDNLFEAEDLLATYYPEEDPFIETSHYAEDHLFETRDLLVNYFPEENVENVSLDHFDLWSPTFSSEDSILSSNFEVGINPGKYQRPPPEPIPRYEIDPNTAPFVGYNHAYAEDGTPIRKGNCPKGKRRICCNWIAADPFSECWYPPGPKPYRLCAPAMNLFCCRSVILGKSRKQGGTGEDCERVPWLLDERRRPKSSEESFEEPSQESLEEPSEVPSRIDLEELFPILQPLPELPDPNPRSCPNDPQLLN
jgi:hypothetical protein